MIIFGIVSIIILLAILFKINVNISIEKNEPKDPETRAYKTYTKPKKLKGLD